MTFYQELQLNQAGSKAHIATFQNRNEKLRHIAIYLFKILLNISFCMGFIAVFSLIFGDFIAGLTVLLGILVFRFSDLGIRASHSAIGILIIFAIFAIGPKVSNLVPLGWTFCINLVCIFLIVLLGCYNVKLCNHSTLVLSYLLLQQYDVSGEAYKMRLIGLGIGAILTAVVVYHNHRKITYESSFKNLFQEFSLSSTRSRWQLRFTFGVSTAMLLASLLGITKGEKAVWVGIAAMSVFFPERKDLVQRVKFRGPGNILGSIFFLIFYFLLPEGSTTYMGILGGISLGLSATYGWQTVSNAFSALAIAVPVLGLQAAIFYRIFNNLFGSIYACLFDRVFEPVLLLALNLKNRLIRHTVS